MPLKCSVPGCSSNYKNSPEYVSVFKFPTEETLFERWVKTVPRKDWAPSKNSCVCIKHFTSDCVLTGYQYKDPSDGQMKFFAYEKPQLKPVYSMGEIFTYNVDDWTILRKQHRIVGEIIGNTSYIPSLPVKILPVEAFLLLKNGLVNICEVTSGIDNSSMEIQKLHEFEEELLQLQIIEYKKIRRQQLESMIDKIVEKRRKVNDSLTPEEILHEELEKSPPITKNNMIWPILLQPLNLELANAKHISMEEVLKLCTHLKSSVYCDLWDRGYFVTQGDKFGGDFLVYLGDPVCHHAIFIVRCVEVEKNIAPSEIVAFGRLGTSVKKRAVLASLVDGKVSYVTINWIDA